MTQGRREGGSTRLDTFCSAGPVPVRAVIHSCVTLPTAALRLVVFIPSWGHLQCSPIPRMSRSRAAGSSQRF